MYVFFVLKENGLLCISLCLQKMGILYFLIIKENRNCVVNFPYVLETLIFFLYCVSGKSRYCKLCFLFNVKKNVALVVSFYVEKKTKQNMSLSSLCWNKKVYIIFTMLTLNVNIVLQFLQESLMVYHPESEENVFSYEDVNNHIHLMNLEKPVDI